MMISGARVFKLPLQYAVEVFELAAPFSNRSYSRIV